MQETATELRSVPSARDKKPTEAPGVLDTGYGRRNSIKSSGKPGGHLRQLRHRIHVARRAGLGGGDSEPGRGHVLAVENIDLSLTQPNGLRLLTDSGRCGISRRRRVEEYRNGTVRRCVRKGVARHNGLHLGGRVYARTRRKRSRLRPESPAPRHRRARRGSRKSPLHGPAPGRGARAWATKRSAGASLERRAGSRWRYAHSSIIT